MSEKNLGKNIAYNLISQIMALVVPLFTAPYIARVFNVKLIGEYSFALANSSYFVLLECLGFALYGQIQVAANRNDKLKTSGIFYEIMILKILLLVASCASYVVILQPDLRTIQGKLCAVMMINIFAAGIDCTWFLSGLEEFRTIAIRSILVRTINLASIYIFIKSDRDLLLYAVLVQGATLISNLSVYPKVFEYLVVVPVKKLRIKRHIAPSLSFFVPGLINTIFSSTDKTMLGVWSSTAAVGTYEQATKITQICMSAICSIGNVLLPRATYLYHNDDRNSNSKADELIDVSLKIVTFIAIPVVVGIAVIADEFVPLFFGAGYEDCVFVLYILIVNVFLTSMSNILGQQCLIARNQQFKYNIAISVSAVCNVVMNVFLIVHFQAVGAAMASLLAGVISLTAIYCYSKNTAKLTVFSTNFFHYTIAAIIMGIVVVLAKTVILPNSIIGMVLHIVIGGSVYFVMLVTLRDSLMKKIISGIQYKGKRIIDVSKNKKNR